MAAMQAGIPQTISESPAPIRVLVADRQPLFRRAIANALERQGDLVVVGEALDGVQVVSEARRSRADVILLDANLPKCDGIEATRRILEESQDAKVIVISECEDHDTLERAIEAGASAYLSRASSLSDLVDAARAASRGETTIPRHMLGALLKNLIHARRDGARVNSKLDQLSQQERVVLELLAKGHSNNGIAEELTISPATARTHVQHILRKLGVHSRLEAAAFVRQDGAFHPAESDS